ncbi:hypothetical protein [Roseibium sp.]|uniref:hypothetical protein n=1 Tax=Roseibium sp. TaxID=1936156 RepID=UPI00261A4886|nr:hypothetical protein [Roseibium sp.]
MAFRSQSPFQILSKLSVKVRVLALSLFTIVGLVAIGGVFFWSQNELNSAFARMGDSSMLAESVAKLSETTADLRAIEKRYLNAPSSESFNAFGETMQAANETLSTVSASASAANYSAKIADAEDTLQGTQGAFEMLDSVQQKIGYDSSQGYLAVLNEKTGAVKDRLQEEMKFGGGRILKSSPGQFSPYSSPKRNLR